MITLRLCAAICVLLVALTVIPMMQEVYQLIAGAATITVLLVIRSIPDEEDWP